MPAPTLYDESPRAMEPTWMTWIIELLCKAPFLLALTAGIVLAIVKISQVGLPAILTAGGLGLALIQTLYMQMLFQVIRRVFGDSLLMFRTNTFVWNIVSAVWVSLLVAAVFVERKPDRNI